jgi:hypothetical protein
MRRSGDRGGVDVVALGEPDRRIHGVFTGAARMAHGSGIGWRDIRFTW